MAKFTDSFTFDLVMQDPEVCRGVLKLILPNEEFGTIRMRPSGNPLYNLSNEGEPYEMSIETEKSIWLDENIKGVRFDAYIKGDNAWADIEMQAYEDFDLTKRSRYYQASIDCSELERGAAYSNLKKSYIIFICTYDPFGLDVPFYFVESYDVKNALHFNDQAYKIVLNAACSEEKVPEELKEFYAYLRSGETTGTPGELISRIDERVKKFSSGKWRRAQMTLGEMMDRKYDLGMKEGLEIGLEKGKIEGLEMGKRETAKRMREEAIPLESIQKITGLTIAEIEAL